MAADRAGGDSSACGTRCLMAARYFAAFSSPGSISVLTNRLPELRAARYSFKWQAAWYSFKWQKSGAADLCEADWM